jgi:hypothetical protein
MTSCPPWPCGCRPYAATFHARCGPAAIVLLHSVACTGAEPALVLRSRVIRPETLRRPVRRRRAA